MPLVHILVAYKCRYVYLYSHNLCNKILLFRAPINQVLNNFYLLVIDVPLTFNQLNELLICFGFHLLC